MTAPQATQPANPEPTMEERLAAAEAGEQEAHALVDFLRARARVLNINIRTRDAELAQLMADREQLRRRVVELQERLGVRAETPDPWGDDVPGGEPEPGTVEGGEARPAHPNEETAETRKGHS